MGPRTYHNAQPPKSKIGTGNLAHVLRTSARPGPWGRKAAQTTRSCQEISCALSMLTAAATIGAQWLPWQPREPLAANPQCRPCLKSLDTFWEIRTDVSYKWLQEPHLTPSICQLQMAPMTPFDTIIWPSFSKGNRPMSRPQKSTPGPNRDSKVPS